MMPSTKNNKSQMIIFIFGVVGFYVFLSAISMVKATAESRETGNFIAAEDWDIGTPPANWPSCGGPAWHGWTPKNYDCQWGSSALSNSLTFTQNRSFYNQRPAGDSGSMDIKYAFTPRNRVYVRMYLNFGSSMLNSNVNQAEDIIHFLFFNTAIASTGFGVDLRVFSDQYRQWPPTCNSSNKSLYFTFHTSHNCNGGEDCYGSSNDSNCFNILEHLEEWFSWEIMWDMRNRNAKMWINGDLIIDRQICSTNYSSISNVILSLWNSTATSYMHDVYIDNIVISDQYIGPIGGGDDAGPELSNINPTNINPTKNCSGFFRNTPISFDIQDDSGVDISSIVMTVNGQTVTPEITGNSSSYRVVYTPTAPFEDGSTVTVNVQGRDLSDRQNTMNEQYSFKINELRFLSSP